MLETKPDGLRGQKQRDTAFTLSDLITTLAVLLVLIILQLSSAATTQGKGQSASCLNNHRQLVRAWQLYADANSGRLVGNLDGGGIIMSSLPGTTTTRNPLSGLLPCWPSSIAVRICFFRTRRISFVYCLTRFMGS